MKPYLSYSCRGYEGCPTDFIIQLHKVNAFYLKKAFGEVHLITDSESKPHFEDIPWTSLTTHLDGVPWEYPQVWSLSKLFAFREIAKKGDPFIHIDNDAVLWKGLPTKLDGAEVFAQHPEEANPYYETEKFLKLCPNKHMFENSTPAAAANCGVFGGTNLAFIHRYAQSSIDLVLDPANGWFWKTYDDISWWRKAVIAEQWSLVACAEIEGVAIKYLFDGWPNEEEAKLHSYTHLMGLKKEDGTRRSVASMADRIVKLDGQLINLGFDHG